MPNVTDDGLPASLSKEAIDLLREELDYDGIVITDAMNMGAIVDYYPDGEAAVKAVEAGVDIAVSYTHLDCIRDRCILCSAEPHCRVSLQKIPEGVSQYIEVIFCGI